MIKTGFLLDNVAVPSHYYELKKKGVIRLNSWQLQLKGKRINTVGVAVTAERQED